MAAAFITNACGRFFHIVYGFYPLHTGQIGGFQKVGGHEIRTAYQYFFDGFCRFGDHDGIDSFADHDGIDDGFFQTVLVNRIGDQFHQVAASEHACFHGIGADTSENGVNLLFNHRCFDRINFMGPVVIGIFRNDAGEGYHAVYGHFLKCF